MLLAELAVDTDDMFLDIGAGVGNVVAQVALGTSAYLSIGIELRTDIHALGTRMMAESAYAARQRERTLFACRNVVDIALSREKPCANATIVLWNNLLFEQSVIEHVKDQLCGMAMIRFLVSSMNLCPIHRASCSRGFCIGFELEKELQLPCSWKAGLLRVFVYKATVID
ncbi:hypothetical protein PF008_g22725 [Phytophthora fragariae]|uniref:Histone-lysine N-methyltransferase, H3 lysine-79 specific n=1 Tax=Phytophthora fragariae TaxID=53985 RepID=A0A6G0QT26_9STRA|nr:hypothetical protein PF008_g22725 [Phytophthora fragariae]